MNRIFRAYRQAPWRTQRQIIGLSLAALIVLSLPAALYLDVTAKSALLGRQIQQLEAEILFNRQMNAHLESRIAEMLSTDQMRRRAVALGYRTLQAEDVEYLPVAGYRPVRAVSLADEPAPKLNAPVIPMEYTQSLLDWFAQRLQGGAAR